MTMQLKCGKCGKVFPLKEGEAGKRLICSACGSILSNPIPPEVRARAVSRKPESGPVPTVPRPADAPGPSFTPWIIAAACVIGLAIALAIILTVRKTGEPDGDRYWRAHYDQLITLKGDAERLAIAGKLPEAHAKYQELERQLAGKTIKDTRLWDLTERAKQDQDKIYQLLMLQIENKVAAERAALQARMVAAAREQAPPTAPYPERFDVLKAEPGAATRQAAPVERPATRPVVAQVNPATMPATRPAIVAAPVKHVGLPISPIPVHPDSITDDQVGESIQMAVNFLLANFQADQIHLDVSPGNTYREGLNALAVFALLKAGQTIPDARLDIHSKEMIGRIERMKDSVMLIELGNPDTPVTYARSLRVAALAVYNRTEDRKKMEEDVTWLLKAASDGSYTYNDDVGKLVQPGQGAILPFIGPVSNGRRLYYIDPSKRARVLMHNGERLVPLPPGTVITNYPPGMGPNPVGTPGFDRLRERLYSDKPEPPWDNSNTQYAHMAIGFAADCGARISPDFWKAVTNHWRVWELQTGQWTYDGKHPLPLFSMTTGGIASLLITLENYEAPLQGAEVGKPGFSPWLAAGLAWMDKEDNSVSVRGNAKYVGYNLFNLSRVGLGSGFKYFGGHDWYREMAGKIISTQYPNGAFGRADHGNDTLIDTAYVILFLSSGREPVMFNKLRYDGPWNNRARDVANLAKFTSREVERPVNAQIVPIEKDWTDWMDSPVLYIAGHEAPKMGEKDYAKLRAFVDAGGLIFTHADGSGLRFNEWVNALVRKIFPGQVLANLPPSHEIYSLQYKLKGITFQGVSNGSRLLLVHCPTDISAAWQLKDGRYRGNFEAGVNVFLYASGKPNLRNRLTSPVIPEIPGGALRTVKLARVRYTGNWDPEPYAFTRFSRYFKRETGWEIDLEPVKLEEVAIGTAPIAHLTGTGALALSDKEMQALARYVEEGGLVVIDACGGNAAFVQSVGQVLGRAFPGSKLEPMPMDHAIFRATWPGMTELTKMAVRPIVEEKLPKPLPVITSLSFGKGMVIVAPLDITSGLLGTRTWGVMGYQSEVAEKILKNIVIWKANQP